jgi:hypothetical protein
MCPDLVHRLQGMLTCKQHSLLQEVRNPHRQTESKAPNLVCKHHTAKALQNPGQKRTPPHHLSHALLANTRHNTPGSVPKQA